MNQSISIDPEFRALIPELAPEEFQQLENNILRGGCHSPLILWANGETNVLIDGHNRHTICLKHNIPFKTEYVQLDDRDHALLWIEQNQLGRRNLTDDQRAVIADSVRERRSEIAKRERTAHATASRRTNVSDGVSDTKVKLHSVTPPRPKADNRAAVAKEMRIPERKLKAVMEIKKAAPELVGRVRAGELSLAEARRQVRRTELNESLNSIQAIEAKELAGLYDVVVIDPPWPVEKIERDTRPNQVGLDYPVMSIEQISSTVGDMLQKHAAADCHIFLWSTHRYLPDALTLLKGWGLTYACCFTWKKNGGFQIVGWPQFNSEFCLCARKGSPRFVDTKQFFTAFDAPRSKHSEKPEEFYSVLRRVTGGRRLDMFNRREIEGFSTWGNQSQ